MDSIAIIGMAGRFPGAQTIEQFWENLREGRDTVSHFQDHELDLAAIERGELADPRYVKARGVLEGVELFDAAFFDMSPREAQISDPQQRLFLECAWEALERAGYDSSTYRGAVGMFGGAGANTYLMYHLASSGWLHGTMNTFQSFIHNKNDHLTARVAYKLDLRGPVVTVQTACSTSMVAVVLACQSLLSYQCDMALAGGVTISLPQRTGYLYHESGIGSPDGVCRPFDAQARGTVGGNGVGLVVLKRLEDALADGDTIHAVIRGAALNNDGADRIGYTAPGLESQAEVIAMAQTLAEVEPESIGYVEAHGTATPIGDPIEVQALTKAFRRQTERRQFCAIGSVKGNIGHLDTAAGVAGLIKTALALRHAQIPPSPHFSQPNPQIDFAGSPFFVNDRLRDWPAGPTPRRAGVSSFGLGGTNTHVVLEEAPEPPPTSPAWPAHLLVVSAKTDSALEQASSNLAAHLKANPALDIADVAHTLTVGRRSMPHRRMLVCRDTAEAAELLGTLAPERVFSRVQEPVSRPVTLMFPGQGAQHPGMARQLYALEPRFRQHVDRCAELLRPHLGLDIRTLLFEQPDQGPTTKDQRPRTNDQESGLEDAGIGRSSSVVGRLEQTQYAQPALFVIEYALAQLWLAWGVRPHSLIGHSVGEYVAATLAGVFSLEDALALIALRGRLIQGLPGGAMLGVPLSEEAVRPLLGEHLALAAVNGPELCVVAGERAAVDALARELTARGLVPRPLHTSHAFHSQMLDPVVGQFAEAVGRLRLSPPQIPFLSNVSGTWITPEQATDPHYWARHMRQTVRFADGLAQLLQDPDAVLLEAGPGRTLRTIARWHPHKKPNQIMLASLPHPQDNQDELAFLLHTLGQLWLGGVALDWAAFYTGQRRRRLPLPTYPFERKRFWVELQRQAGPAAALTTEEALRKKADIAEWFYQPVWQRTTVVRPVGPAPAPAPGAWLVFGAGELGGQLARTLEPAVQHLVRVEPGAAFRRVSERHYQIDPQRPADYEALLAALKDGPGQPQTVVHAWSLASPAPLEHGFSSLLALAQALGSQRAGGPLRLVVLSADAQEVAGGDLANPDQATLAGPCLVIPREYPHITCQSIDLSLAAGARALALQLDLLRWELGGPADEPFLAYRGGYRWRRGYEQVRLAHPEPTPLRSQGVYLITGGLGGLGLTFAAHLARRAQARLVLVGRSGLPAREEWDAWLASHPADEPTARKLRQLKQIVADAADVLICQADVTDPAQIRAAVGQALAQYGAIHGVIHAAGVPAGGLIQLKQQAAAAQVLAPKIQGTYALAQALEQARPDFLLLCSSLTSVVGRLGQVDYTAANAFLDAFARQHQARTGTPTVAVNWGAWSEVGMAVVPSAAPQATPGQPDPSFTPHPLLERRLKRTPEQQVFATDFTVEKHWVLDEHRILGHPVIPGVAYFEMTRAALGVHPRTHAVEFKEVFFVAPLRVPDGLSREVRLVIEPAGEGYRFAIRSQEQGQERAFTVGSVQLTPAAPLRRHDLDALRARCNVQELILPAEQREEDLGPRWHSVQRVHIGVHEVLLELHLPAAFAADFDQMVFHPALLDRAAGIAKNFLAEGHYLPLTYRSLKIKAPLQPKIYSYARFYAEENPDRDTITFDILLMNEQGEALVEIERFTQKRVNDPAAELRALAGTLDASGPAEATSQEISPPEGAEALERILAQRDLTQVIVSVRDLEASIRYTDTVVQERISEARASTAAAASARRPRPALSVAYAAPRSATERAIAEVWGELLGVEQIGINDNFFELGGDSLVGIEAVTRLSKQLQVEIPAVNLFEGPTIGALASIVDQTKGADGRAQALAEDDSRSRADKRQELRTERRARRVEIS